MSTSRKDTFQPGFDQLEQRTAPAISIANGILSVSRAANSNVVAVVGIYMQDQELVVTENGVTQRFASDSVSSIKVQTGRKADTVYIDDLVFRPADIRVNGGADTVRVGGGAAKVDLGADRSKDTLYKRANTVVTNLTRRDRVFVLPDVVRPPQFPVQAANQNGNALTVNMAFLSNISLTSTGQNKVKVMGTLPGTSTQVMKEFSGVSGLTVLGTPENDSIDGMNVTSEVKLTVLAGDGNDLIHGGAGDDTLGGERGNDTIHGNGGKDLIIGGEDNDLLFGNDGNDEIRGNEGDDTATGGAGTDTFTDVEHVTDPEIPPFPFQASNNNGTLMLLLTPGQDKARVVLDTVGATITDLVSGQTVTIPGPFTSYRIDGSSGDDTITIDTNLPGEVYGGDGNDSLTVNGPTGAGIYGERGNDILTGSDGDDLIIGGEDNDVMFGRDGKDDIRGNEGDDTATGGAGDDTFTTVEHVTDPEPRFQFERIGNKLVIQGTSGDDTIQATVDNNATIYDGENVFHIPGPFNEVTIDAGAGNDSVLVLTQHKTTVLGGDGNDTITVVGNGESTLGGEAGDDILEDGNGPGTLIGGPGNDFLFGNGGDDTISGSEGFDTALAGDGDDEVDNTVEDWRDPEQPEFPSGAVEQNGMTLTVRAMHLKDPKAVRIGLNQVRISGFVGNYEVSADFSGVDRVIMEGTAGNDVLDASGLTGDDIDAFLLGGDGNDTLVGGGGDDILGGEGGNDLMIGNGGADTFNGGDGTEDTADAVDHIFANDVIIDGEMRHRDTLEPDLFIDENSGEVFIEGQNVILDLIAPPAGAEGVFYRIFVNGQQLGTDMRANGPINVRAFTIFIEDELRDFLSAQGWYNPFIEQDDQNLA